MKFSKEDQTKLKDAISKEKIIIREIDYLFNNLLNKEYKVEEKYMIISQMDKLKNSLKEINNKIPEIMNKMSLVKPLPVTYKATRKKTKAPKKEKKVAKKVSKKFKEPKKIKKAKGPKKKAFQALKKIKKPKEEELTSLEKLTLLRFRKKKKKITVKKEKKPNKYVGISSKIFSNLSRKLIKKNVFNLIEKDLIKSNLEFTPLGYASIILFTLLISAIVGLVLVLGLFFLSLENFPLIALAEELTITRFLKFFGIIFALPIMTFALMYFYPSLEKKSSETKINQELPFAAIHMSTIAGSMIEPSKIFEIIIKTKEYPRLEREFKKVLNFINIYGYDLVTSLGNVAKSTPSKKLADLFNTMGTTIKSGGDLPDFFKKRSESLLFEYRLEREKYIKFSETFMDLYISTVIAAPMILMLLLMMIKIGGLGLPVSSTTISLMMVSGIAIINVIFLVFLHLKQPGG